MPLYEYRCRRCEERFEELRRLDERDAQLACPACGDERVERLLSSFATSASAGSPAPAPSCKPTRGFT